MRRDARRRHSGNRDWQLSVSFDFLNQQVRHRVARWRACFIALGLSSSLDAGNSDCRMIGAPHDVGQKARVSL